MPAADKLHVVIFRTDRLGELMLTLPVAAALRAAYPTCRITCVVEQAYADLVRLHPAIDEVVSVAWAGRRVRWVDVRPLIRQLRHSQYTVAIVSNPHKWLHWAVWRAGIARRIGYDRKWSWCLTDCVPDRKGDMTQHEVYWNVSLLTPLGITVDTPQLCIPVPDDTWPTIQQRLMPHGFAKDRPIVALHPWASCERKRWPLASFCAVAQQIASDGWAQVLVLGSDEHRAEAAAMCQGLPSAINVTGRLTVVELATVLANCRYLVTNDSGPAHVASSVGTPTITLFGGTQASQSPARWRPWGPQHTVLHRQDISAIVPTDVMIALRNGCASCIG